MKSSRRRMLKCIFTVQIHNTRTELRVQEATIRCQRRSLTAVLSQNQVLYSDQEPARLAVWNCSLSGREPPSSLPAAHEVTWGHGALFPCLLLGIRWLNAQFTKHVMNSLPSLCIGQLTGLGTFSKLIIWSIEFKHITFTWTVYLDCPVTSTKTIPTKHLQVIMA